MIDLGLAKFSHHIRLVLILCRPSGNPCKSLHVLGINPTFSVDPMSPFGMLNPSSPSMGLVVKCGLTHENCYGTDLFPLHVNIDRLEVKDKPFNEFPKFENLFLSRYLQNFLGIGGKVVLVFGSSALDTLTQHFKARKIHLADQDDNLCILWEKV
jgi:hypothetical protein